MSNLYEILHKSSSSKAQIKCTLDEYSKPRILSIKMISGNVITLAGVKSALSHFYDTCQPNQSA